MPTFGEELRRERELREITLREVSQATKISMRYLEAMERNDFSFLPGGLFNRGFVRAYCQYIGIDSESMVNAYLLEEQAQRTGGGPDSGLLRGRPSASGTATASRSSGSTRVRWIALVIVLLLAAGAWAVVHFVGWPVGASESSNGTRARPGSVERSG